jgi:hypothetical protein
VAQSIESLLCKHEALSSNLSPTNTKQKIIFSDWSCFIAQSGWELMILFPRPPQYWDYRCLPQQWFKPMIFWGSLWLWRRTRWPPVPCSFPHRVGLRVENTFASKRKTLYETDWQR